jgi:hypothetical protein
MVAPPASAIGQFLSTMWRSFGCHRELTPRTRRNYSQERMNRSHVHSSWAKHQWIYNFRTFPGPDLYKLLLIERPSAE